MLPGMVDELVGVSDNALTERFRALELRRRATEAEMAAIVREGERRGLHTVDGHRSMKHWVLAQTNCPSSDAARLRRLAVALDDLPGVGDALHSGWIGTAQAHELARLRSNPRCGDQVAGVAQLLLRHAEHLPFDDFRVVTRRWEVIADLDGAQRNDDLSHERRTASVLESNGSADVRASGGSGMVTAELLGIFERFVEAEFAKDVAARTERFGPDAPASSLPRTDGQRRFDALTEIFRAAVVAPADGVPPEPVVNLLVGLRTYEELLARTGIVPSSRTGDSATDLNVERLESSSGVPLAPDDVIAASLHGLVRRVVIDGAGVVVDAGRKRRLFTGSARELVLLLAGRCGHAGCTVAAERCQVDHLDEWTAHGGATDQHNAGPRCSTHNPWKSTHRLRTRRDDHGYVVDTRADGTPMLPVGRRRTDDASSCSGWRVRRIRFCRLQTPDGRAELLASMHP